MNSRERVNAILHYRNYDKMPVVHFGFWGETLTKWKEEGYLSEWEATHYWDNGGSCKEICDKLGFDFAWSPIFSSHTGLMPSFEGKVLQDLGDGWIISQNGNGLIEKLKRGVSSIPATIGTLLEDRKSWEELYLPKLQPSEKRYDLKAIEARKQEFDSITDLPVGYHVGSLYGFIRDMLGVENLAYLQADDEDLFVEIIDTVANICYENAKAVFSTGVKVDYCHYWEDICFKNGPLVNPEVFEEYVLPHYRKISDMLLEHGVDIISLDCDGCIDKLVPIWLKGGVNTMFPIEVGTWEASIEPWKKQYGNYLRGVGGMDKRVFALDYAAVDKEIERLKRLIDLGGYIPCPDHRIAPDAKWDNVKYYCDKMQNLKI